MNSIKPFWSWNDLLTKEELRRQIHAMKDHGIDGFFMHARGGLETPYMGNDWFEMIGHCMQLADELDMQAWAYDENGWPSGFADGLVPALGLEHQQKTLRYKIAQDDLHCENLIAAYRKTDDNFVLTDTPSEGDYFIYFEVNPYYVDGFHAETIAKFLEFTHDKYYERLGERFGTALKGFFTDEPQYRRSPWSFVFPNEFYKRYGYDLLEKLPLLFFEAPGYEAFRSDYYEMVADLFRTSFIKQMYDWCEAHNCKLTGHMMNEQNLHSQMSATGGVMACYEYFHEPGMDHLGRKVESPAQPKQVGSVAAQLGRKTMTETFALCGWDVSLNELKWIAQWQYLNGVTSLCPHLQAYSLRGCRKRDYPPSLFYQLPWFDIAYKDFADYFTSLGRLLDSGKDVAPLLVIHPMHSAYILDMPFDDQELMEYSEQFDAFTEELNAYHILHHYGDETIMAHFGSVEGNTLRVGNCSYQAVLLPNLINLTTGTIMQLMQFAECGGSIYSIGRTPVFENGRKTYLIQKLSQMVTICESLEDMVAQFDTVAPCRVYDRETKENCGHIHLNLKQMPDGKKLLYLINNQNETRKVRMEIQGTYALAACDTTGAKLSPISAIQTNGRTVSDLEFAEYGSMLILLETAPAGEVSNEEICRIALDKHFTVQEADDNALTLDKCTYRLDGGPWQPEMAVINLHNKVLALQRSCCVDMQFRFVIEKGFDFSDIHLCMETPEKYEILVNDVPYAFRDVGQFVDHAIRKSPIGELLHIGENTIILSCVFTQTPELYHAKFTPGVHESVLNKLTYDTELESIYLTGNFGVQMEEPYTYGQRRCIHGGRNFALVPPASEVNITDLTPQGYWFFAGKISLTQTVRVEKQKNVQYLLSLRHLNAPAAVVYVNGQFAGKLIFAPFELNITEQLQSGENEVTIQLLSGNRNLFGPHHKPMGESYFVGPSTFSDIRGWADDDGPTWTDDYNFVIFGCEL